MKVLCSQEELARSLQIAGRGMSAKSTLPILSGMLLETRGDSLTVLSTDLELGIEVTVPQVTVVIPGKVVLPGKMFIDIIRHLPPGRVEIALEEEKSSVSILSSHASFQLNTLPTDEFPSLPDSFREVAAVLNREDEEDADKIGGSVIGSSFREAIRQTIFATSPEDPRPFLSSVLLEIYADRLKMVATDINRLVIREIPFRGKGEEKILVPVRALRECSAIFGNDPEESINMVIADRQIFLFNRHVVFSSRLIDSQFPRYEQVIPSEFIGTMKVGKSDFQDALERNSLLDNVVKLSITREGLFITSNEPELGNAYEEVACTYSGEEMQIGFNARFIIDFLKSISQDDVYLKLSGVMKAAMLQAEGQEDYRYIVMPMRLNA
jgi:DNA polymerase-3 subunit beta